MPDSSARETRRLGNVNVHDNAFSDYARIILLRNILYSLFGDTWRLPFPPVIAARVTRFCILIGDTPAFAATQNARAKFIVESPSTSTRGRISTSLNISLRASDRAITFFILECQSDFHNWINVIAKRCGARNAKYYGYRMEYRVCS